MTAGSSPPPPQEDHPRRSAQNLKGILPFTYIPWIKVLLFFFSLFLFFIALETMKTGAQEMTGFARRLSGVDDLLSGIGLGWLTSYLTLSGSPIAAISLTLFDIASINEVATFGMIVGSRIGGSLIVIFIGVIYILQGHDRGTSLLTGILSFMVTGLIYIPATPLGLFLLDRISLPIPFISSSSSLSKSPVDRLLGPLRNLMVTHLPDWVVFGLGVVLTLISLELIDKALPEFELEENIFGEVPDLLYRPLISFLLGFAFTLITMSVSISLGLLVPLSVRGYIKRENLLPYIMGSNISTFLDTVIAGLLLRNPEAANLVLVQTLSVTIISLLILFFIYRPFQKAILRSALWMNEKSSRLLVFSAVLFLIPLVLIFT
ncbi:MAG: hypothetical protein KGY39_05900 [Anaerolineales bacterium]|nr:hypothetical protein [Anaerolineales bacterium]MBS3753035.1 hypothetical protein [Anaerolineales bacterium]